MNRLEKLLKKMTLREKLAQMVQVLPFVFTDDVDRNSLTGPLKELNVKQEDLYNIGTVYPALNVFDSEIILNLKKQYFEKNPHGIPLLVANDVVHGLRTIFPFRWQYPAPGTQKWQIIRACCCGGVIRGGNSCDICPHGRPG